jgi:hypothetical protein
MSLGYIGRIGRGELAAPMWLFSIQASALQANKMAGVIKKYLKFRVVVGFLQAEGVNQSDIHRRLLVCVFGQNLFSGKKDFVWRNKFEYGQKALNVDPEKHRGSPRTFTDDDYVIVEGLKMEDLKMKVRKIAEETVQFVPHRKHNPSPQSKAIPVTGLGGL